MTPTITFVTVVYEPEVPLLVLQARSLGLHVDPADVGEVLVIDNSGRGMPARTVERLRDAYGPHASRLRVLRPRDVALLPATVGWFSQQVFKLAVADRVQDSHYVVLDAKNHFVRPVGRSTFVAPDGRPRANVYGYETHPLRPSLVHVLGYLDVDPAPHLARFTATITPYVIETATARELTADVARRSGQSFAREFVRARLTEFFLSTGWMLARRGGTLETHVSVPLGPVPLLWPGPASRGAAEATREVVAAARQPDAVSFAVHGRAFEHLDEDAVSALAELWREAGLVRHRSEAADLVSEVVRLRASTRRRQLVRELPAVARTLPGRLARRIGGARSRRR